MQGIFSMLCGFLIYSWKGYNAMNSGHCFVPMKLQVWPIAGEMTFRSCIIDMKERQAECWTWMNIFFQVTKYVE